MCPQPTFSCVSSLSFLKIVAMLLIITSPCWRVPAWRGAIEPRSPDPKRSTPATFDTNVMRSVQVYHLLGRKSSIESVKRVDGKLILQGAEEGRQDVRDGFGWTGSGTIGRSARWPRWTPPPEMIERDPSLAKWRDGQPGGVANPLGARALYIYFGGRDSGYRIHGTNTPKSIGWAASSGCFRMLNQDVMDLYERVELGAKVVVI